MPPDAKSTGNTILTWAPRVLLALTFIGGGVAMMLCVLAGAFVAQLGPLRGEVIHVLVMAAIVGLALWLRRRAQVVRTV